MENPLDRLAYRPPRPLIELGAVPCRYVPQVHLARLKPERKAQFWRALKAHDAERAEALGQALRNDPTVARLIAEFGAEPVMDQPEFDQIMEAATCPA